MVEYELEKIGSFSPDRICKSLDERTVSFLSGLTLHSFHLGKEQSGQLTESCIDIAASNDLIFCLSTSQKILVLDNKDLEEVYIIDLSEENASFHTLSISNDQLILQNQDFAEIRSFQGDQKLRINCSNNTFVFLFDPEIVVLLEEIDFSVSITLRHKKQIHQTSLDGRVRQVFADQSSNSIIIFLDHGGLYQIDCRHLSPLQKYEIPWKPTRPIDNMQFSESTNLLAFQVKYLFCSLSIKSFLAKRITDDYVS